MKTILYFFVFSCFFSTYSQTKKHIESIVVKTSFNGRHCNGHHGLCDIEFIGKGKNNSANGILYYSDNTLKLVLDRSKITGIEENKVFHSAKASKALTMLMYNLNYDFDISSNIISHLNIKNGFHKITKGYYPLEVTEESIIITFKL